jgi:hypothetical protein
MDNELLKDVASAPPAAQASAEAPRPATDGSSTEKLHYFAFSFTEMDNNAIRMGSIYTGFLDRNITVPRIRDAKASAGMADTSVLLAVSYLGFMTRAEVAPDLAPPVVAPSPAPTDVPANAPR